MLFLCFVCSALAGYGAPLSEAMRREDPRLREKRVTIAAKRIFVGELLERLSRQTGVTLAANERDGAADERIAVFLRNVPLGDALDALWSLVSDKHAAWDWERSNGGGGAGGNYSYRLLRPRAAQLLASQLREQVQEEFEARATTSTAALKMSREEREKLAHENPPVDLMNKWPDIEQGIGAFAALAPEDQSHILLGLAEVKVPINNWTGETQDFVKSKMADFRRANKERGIDLSSLKEPTWVRFATQQFPNKATPSLVIYIEGIGGNTYVGGTQWENEWRSKLTDSWLLSGDLAEGGDTAAAARKMEAPKGSPPEPKFLPTEYVAALRLSQVADAVPVSVMARLPRSKEDDPGLPYGQTLAAYFKRLDEDRNLAHKWRSGVLLVRSNTWFLSDTEETRPSYAALRALRQAEEKAPDHFLSVEDLARTARRQSSAQLRELSKSYGLVSQIAPWRDLFARMDRLPEFARQVRLEAGVPLTQFPDDERARMELQTLLEQNRSARLRVQARLADADGIPSMTISIQVLSSDSATVLRRSDIVFTNRQGNEEMKRRYHLMDTTDAVVE